MDKKFYRSRWFWAGLIGAALAFALVFIFISSYEYQVESRTPEYNIVVRVSRSISGHQFLRFYDDSIQSASTLSDFSVLVLPHARAIAHAIGGCRPQSERFNILVIGMGGGNLPLHFYKRCPNAYIDAVDIDPIVVFMARKYFQVPDDERFKIHVVDGAVFVGSADRKYDVVILDAFNGLDAPHHLQTHSFLTAVRRIIRDGGVVASNIIAGELNPGYEAFIDRQRSAFGEVTVFEVAGAPTNRVVAAVF